VINDKWLNQVQICAWNQPVLSYDDEASCWRKQVRHWRVSYSHLRSPLTDFVCKFMGFVSRNCQSFQSNYNRFRFYKKVKISITQKGKTFFTSNVLSSLFLLSFILFSQWHHSWRHFTLGLGKGQLFNINA